MDTNEASLKIVVIAGGQLHEREISLRSAGRLATQLKAAGHQVELVDLNQNLIPFLQDAKPDLVWPMIHGREGESGSLQDLLELLGLNYVGSRPAGCRISQSKPVAKSVVEKNDLNTPPSVCLPKILFRQVGAQELLSQVASQLGYPLIVKPAAGGSAMGISYVDNLDSFKSAMVDAFAYDDEVLIEKFVAGTEISVSLIELDHQIQALPLIEIKTDRGHYDYDARYLAGRTEFFIPARLDSQAAERAQKLALDCHRVLELSDLSRIDLIVDQSGEPWFIDANTIPGMTDMSLWPQAAEAHSSFGELVNALVLSRMDTQKTDL